MDGYRDLTDGFLPQSYHLVTIGIAKHHYWLFLRNGSADIVDASESEEQTAAGKQKPGIPV
jgi:hypothetical protein